MLASTLPIGESIRVQEIMIYKILHSTLKQAIISEIYHTISNKHTLHVDFLVGRCVGVQVVVVDPHCQIWNVFASVRLPGDPESILTVFGVVGEEIFQGFEIVIGSVEIIVDVGSIGVGRISDTCRRLQK